MDDTTDTKEVALRDLTQSPGWDVLKQEIAATWGDGPLLSAIRQTLAEKEPPEVGMGKIRALFAARDALVGLARKMERGGRRDRIQIGEPR